MSYVDTSLQEITGNRGLAFGGLSVITVGDFY